MASPTGIIPEALMLQGKKKEVVRFLIDTPLPSTLKRELLLGWAQTVGIRLQARDFRAVEESGIDWPGGTAQPGG